MAATTGSITTNGETGRLARLRRFLEGFHDRTVLFRSGRLIFTTYGLLEGGAFLVGSLAAIAYTSLTGGDPFELIWFSALILFPAVLVGARLFSVLLEWRELLRSPLKTLLKPGYMLHGGVAGGAAAIIGYGYWGGAPILPLMDAWALALPVGEAIARVGCYVYGCCWGKQTTSAVGICYTSPEAKVLRFHPHLSGKRIYPVQLIGTGAHLLLFLLLVALIPVLPHHGMLTGAYLIAHPLLRVVLERFREDDRGRLFGPFTHTNLYSAIQMAIGIALTAVTGALGSPVAFTLTAPLAVFTEQPAIIGYLIALFALTAIAFGVHVDRVGSWVADGPAAHRHSTPSLVPIRVEKS
jgi:prolipoprotein diacylglyceryltransferase